MAAAVAQFEPVLIAKTYAILDNSFAKIQQYEDNVITKAIKDCMVVFQFLSSEYSSESIAEAVNERLSKYTPPKDNPQLVEIALANIKQVGDEARGEFQKYLTSALDSLEKYPSNVAFKILVKIDLLLSFDERTKGTGSLPSSSEMSDEDQTVAADVPKIMNSLAADFGIVSAVAEILESDN